MPERFPVILRTPAGFWLILLFLLLGDFLGISQISPTINYNYLNGGLLFLASGLLFTYSATSRKSGSFLLPVLAGLLAGIDFFVKFTSSGPFLGMAMLFVLWPSHWNRDLLWTDRLKAVLYLGLGYLLGIGLYFLLFNPFPIWYANFMASFHTQTGGSHSPFRVLGKQVADFKRLGINLVQYYALPLALSFGVAWKTLRHNVRSSWWMLAPVILVLNIFLAWHLYKLTNFRFYTLAYFSVLLLLLGLNVVMDSGQWLRKRASMALFLLLLPFVLVFGSDSSFSYSIPLYLLPWFGLIFLMLQGLPAGPMRISLASVLIVLVQLQFVVGYLYFPWRWPANRLAQSESVVGVRGLFGIKVDKATHRFMLESRQLAQSRKVSPWILAFYEMPGVVYWLDGKSPGLPWFSHNKHEQAGVCQALGSISAEERQQALVLQQEPFNTKLLPCLRELGFDLRRYRLVGSTYNPYSHRKVWVYAPPDKELLHVK
jgi:hypothetical protein